MTTLKFEYRQLGRTGAKVSPLCLGAMNFGNRTEAKDAVQIIHRFLDYGLNFIDTSNSYSRGESERIVGDALKGRRQDVVLATKVYGKMGDSPNERGTSRLHIMNQVEQSLQRLQTDYIDLYWAHRPDLLTPVDETLRTFDDLVRQGKVRYIGCSTFPAWKIMEALAVSEKMNLEHFIAEQPPYNLFDRSLEEDVVPLAEKYGLGVMPWGPLASGWLSGAHRKGQPISKDARIHSKVGDLDAPYVQERLEVIERLTDVAESKETTLSRLALAWLMAQPTVTAPIIGPRTMAHLEDNVQALNVLLTEEDLARIDDIVPPKSRVGGKRHNE